MQDEDGPRRGIRRIISECSQHNNFKEDTRYLLRKSHEMKAVQSKIELSIRRLKTLQAGDSDQEEEKPTEYREMAETFYAQLERPHVISLKSLAQSPDKANKIRSRFLNIERSRLNASSYRSPRSPKTNPDSKSAPRIHLPNLLSKMRKGKLPTNASRSKIMYLEQGGSQISDQDNTYEKIKIERRKLEQTRHLVVLGKVYDENYRKNLRNLWELKRKRKVKI